MFFFFVLLLRTKSNCFLGRGYGGVFTARRRWRFDTSIFRISKVDPPTNPLRNRICRSRDPFLDHLFAHFLSLWKAPNWRSWRHGQNKIAIWGFFGANSQCIYDQCILCFLPFLTNQLRFALLPCTVYLVKLWFNTNRNCVGKTDLFVRRLVASLKISTFVAVVVVPMLHSPHFDRFSPTAVLF